MKCIHAPHYLSIKLFQESYLKLQIEYRYQQASGQTSKNPCVC